MSRQSSLRAFHLAAGWRAGARRRARHAARPAARWLSRGAAALAGARHGAGAHRPAAPPVLIRQRLERFPALAGLGFGAVLVVTAVLGVVTQRALRRMEHELQPSLELTIRVTAYRDAVRGALETAEAEDDGAPLAAVDSVRAEVRRTVARAAGSVPARGPARAPGAAPDSLDAAALGRAFDVWAVAAREATALDVRLEPGGEAQVLAEWRAWSAHQTLERVLARRSARDRAAIADAFRRVGALQAVMWVGIAGVAALALGALVVLARRLARGIAEPLRAVVAAAERIADGELDVVVPEAPADELGQLVGALRRTLARLSGTIADLRASEAQLAHQAFTDALTGLANRALFRDRLAHALARTEAGRGATAAAPDGERVAVLLLDLDDFKAVNDSLGHGAGDRLLAQVARRLERATRGCDTVARLGGDEFAVLVEPAGTAEDVAALAERLVGAMRRPMRVDGREVPVGASVGVALSAPGLSPEGLLRNADVAMYAAKAARRDTTAGASAGFRLFDGTLLDAVVHRVELERDLARAVARGRCEEFRLHYQPIVDLGTGRVAGAEALVRWQHPTRGLVPPGHFVPLAEETGHVVALGRWVLETACREAAAWPAPAGGPAPGISVNVSGRQLAEPSLLDDVTRALGESGLAPARLTLEVTETVLMRDTANALAALHALKALGVRLAVDDFGTGYSSLSYLRQFPVDVLKIDKSFVDGVARGGHDAALARTIVALADMLGLRTVAEGVEHEAQRDALGALGCALGQGYLFARPLAADAMRAYVAERAGRGGRGRRQALATTGASRAQSSPAAAASIHAARSPRVSRSPGPAAK